MNFPSFKNLIYKTLSAQNNTQQRGNTALTLYVLLAEEDVHVYMNETHVVFCSIHSSLHWKTVGPLISYSLPSSVSVSHSSTAEHISRPWSGEIFVL